MPPLCPFCDPPATRLLQEVGASLFQLRQTAPDLWSSLVSSVSRTICVMPLWKLQTVGSERMDFLYENLDRGTEITLKPGVAYCFRTFYGLLRNLIQGAWVRFVQNLNANRLGHITDLSSLLFGRERESLAVYRDLLLDIQHGQCFYCKGDLRRQVDVDHFIPWSRYPTDLGHNFVLAHPRCNSQKSDHLAAEEHLQAWGERNRIHEDELGRRLFELTLPADVTASVRIATWAYSQTESANGQVWIVGDAFRHLGNDWRRLLVA